MKQRLTRSVTLPMMLFGVVLALIVSLAVMWNVALVNDYVKLRGLLGTGSEFHWRLVAVGATFVVLVIVLLGVLASQLASEIRWNVRQSNFIASVTHELNSPLSSIKLYAQTLRGDVKAEDRARFVEIMLHDVDRLGRMVGNVLRAAQLDQGPLRIHPEVVALGPYLSAYAAEASLALGRRGRGDTIRVEARDDAPSVAIDGPFFRQVLDNLVDNSLKYCQGGHAEIELVAAREGHGRASIAVRDHGIGIPKNELRRVFERFYRVEDPSRSRKGTGLGLWIVRSLVEAHGGEVVAESEGEGRGATLRILLPLAPVGETAKKGEVALA